MVGQVVRSDWIWGTCEQDEQVDKKSRQPDRLGLGERTFRQRMGPNGMRQPGIGKGGGGKKDGADRFRVRAAWPLLRGLGDPGHSSFSLLRSAI